MRDDADELLRGVARQARVGIERDAIAHRRENVQLADLHGEARVGGASQQPVEFFDLAAFALPPHPRVFPRVPAPLAMEQEEAIRVLGAEPLVEGLDCPRAQRRGVGGSSGSSRASASAKSLRIAKWMMRVEVAEREHLDVLEQRRDRVGARQHRRHDDHRAGVVGNAVREVEARQPTGRDRPGDDALRDARSRCRPPVWSRSRSNAAMAPRGGARVMRVRWHRAPTAAAVTAAIGPR